MKKIEDEKYYLQIYDVLFIADQGNFQIPKTIWDKIFMDDSVLDTMNTNTFLELTTNEELMFYSNLSDVYSINELDDKPIEVHESAIITLAQYLQNLKIKYQNDKLNMNVEERKELDYQINLTEYKIKSLNIYIKERQEKNKNRIQQ